ncbi:hypothetical protein [Nonomuraea roseola]|uniref:Dolichyl-phosphate-mannose--protein mannosyltransferase n=1 Tax=Nonomuraea roseola TaxID=46179 RepID=A0ABV5PZD8_9ACTN
MTALLTAVSPTVYFWIDDGGGGSFTWGSAGRCLGNELSDQLWFMSGLPLFWYGGAPQIVLGFLGWYLAVRVGRERLARALARVAAGALLVCGKVSTESELDCDGLGDGTANGFSKAEKDFLCRAHGHTAFHGEGDALAAAPDQVLLERGYRLCKMAEHDIQGDQGVGRGGRGRLREPERVAGDRRQPGVMAMTCFQRFWSPEPTR